MEQIKIYLKRDKKTNTFINATITLKKSMLEYMDNPKKMTFSYEDGIITICKKNSEANMKIVENGKIIKLVKDIKLQKKNAIYIPTPILTELGLEINSTNLLDVYYLEDKKISFCVKNKFVKNKKEIYKMGKILTIKVNKGGVGKTFLTVQLGHYLALQGKKVLLLTSDSQNNIFDYTGIEEKELNLNSGLKQWVLQGNGNIVRLRDNLFFIPLESSTFGTHFLLKLPKFLEELKEKYDYILIDSIPTMRIDSVFVDCSDNIIIPAFCDKVTVNGAINVIKEAGVDKVLALIVNKYENKKIQNLFKKEIEDAVNGTGIIYPKAIINTSKIENLLYRGKTIWECNNKIIRDVQNSLEEVGEAILGHVATPIIDNEDDDFDIDF